MTPPAQYPEYGIAMDGAAQMLGLDMFAYHPGDVYRAIEALQADVAFLNEVQAQSLQALADAQAELARTTAYHELLARALRNFHNSNQPQ